MSWLDWSSPQQMPLILGPTSEFLFSADLTYSYIPRPGKASLPIILASFYFAWIKEPQMGSGSLQDQQLYAEWKRVT